MKISRYSSWEEVQKIKEDWKRLEILDPDASFYQNYLVNSSWWKTKGEGKELCVLSLEHNGKIIGLFPLFSEKRKEALFTWKELKFLGLGDYRGPIIDTREVQAKRIFHHFLEYMKNKIEYDRLVLSNLEGDSEFVHFLFSSGETNPHCQLLVEAPFVKIDDDFSMEELSQRMPSNTRKYRNRLERDHGLHFSVKEEMTLEDLEEIGTLHSKQQKAMRRDGRLERVSLYDDESTRNYLEEILDQDHHLLFQIKNNKGELMAYRYCFLKNNRYYSWNSAYDYSYRNYRLNNTSLLETLNYLSSLKEDLVFDMGAGRYPWKFRWTKDYKSLYIYDVWKEESSKILRNLQKLKGFLNE